MTPKTLQKERREKFEAILRESKIGIAAYARYDEYDVDFFDADILDLARELAEASVSRSEVRGIEAAMFANREVTEEDLPVSDEALKAFERDVQCPGSWSWYPAKSSDEPAWKALRDFVVRIYQSDPKAFEKYYTWASQPFSRGAKTIGQIREDPTCFEYAWAAYIAVEKLKKVETQESWQDRSHPL